MIAAQALFSSRNSKLCASKCQRYSLIFMPRKAETVKSKYIFIAVLENRVFFELVPNAAIYQIPSLLRIEFILQIKYKTRFSHVFQYDSREVGLAEAQVMVSP